MNDLNGITKICAKCRESKSLFNFCKDKSRVDGLFSWCKLCSSSNQKRILEKNRKQKISIESQKCPICNETKLIDMFSKQITSRTGFRCICKSCISISGKKYRTDNKESVAIKKLHDVRKRQAAKIFATPSWADYEKIKLIYRQAFEIRKLGRNVHVDHIIPLRGKNVCGLHVEGNLQIIDAVENLSKFNKFEIEY